MIVKQVYNSVDGILQIPQEVLPANGQPFAHHFQSTPGDNLIELAGRVCYNSAQQEKTRGTVEYHKHINEVGHWSTHGHLNITIELSINKHTDELYEYLTCFINKPGFHIVLTNKDEYTHNLRITGNLRAIREWFTFNTEIPKESGKFDYLGYCLQNHATRIAPGAMHGAIISRSLYQFIGNLVAPVDPDEIWVSYYIGGVSRSLTHELCRHGFSTGISQRSSRYCDESESGWAWHPLIEKYKKDSGHITEDLYLPGIQYEGQLAYKNIAEHLKTELITNGIDKHTALKQSRGAARGVLGNALSTELIFSASLAQWQRIILMRSRDEADAEIRLMTNEIFKDLKEKWPNHFYNYTSRPAKDGIGLHVEKI